MGCVGKHAPVIIVKDIAGDDVEDAENDDDEQVLNGRRRQLVTTFHYHV